MKNHLFFRSSRETFNEVTSLFDFLWPTAAAMWNLRWQVDGYLRIRPQATVHELSNRFVVGSAIHGANLKRACVDLTWEQQQEQFAKFLLINIFALHESSLKRVLEDLGNDSKDLEKQLQFPTSTDAFGRKKGIWGAIDTLTLPESTMLKNGFYAKLSGHNRNSKQILDNLMKCYRYFKECRNSLAHNGSTANRNAADAYTAFAAVATNADLGVSEVPQHIPVIEGAPVRLMLRGVVGFCDVILKIIVTLDAELSRSKSAEQIFKEYWLEKHQTRHTLKSDPVKRSNQIKQLIARMNLPTPPSTDEFETFIRTNLLVATAVSQFHSRHN
jgi:hypothetical protein